MDFQLKDKAILIATGGGAIGSAIARASAAEGAIPVIIDRDRQALAGIEKELRAEGKKYLCVSADVGNAEECRKCLVELTKSCGTIGALVNHAEIAGPIGLAHGTIEDYIFSMQRGLLPYYNMAHFALPHLKEGNGTIVNIAPKTASSGAGEVSSSSRGAIFALTREWAVELLPYGIRVNTVAQGAVTSPLWRQEPERVADKGSLRKTAATSVLKNRMTEAEEIAAMTMFLISRGSAHTTGQHVFVAGGMYTSRSIFDLEKRDAAMPRLCPDGR